MLGLAVGDALGARVEGAARDSYPLVTDFAASEQHGLAAGEWTDDTAMAICLAESLLACRGFNALDVADRFLRWYRHGENAAGARAVGFSSSTRGVIEAFEASRRLDAAESVGNAGNGCIMRLAPAAILRRTDRAAARELATAQARLTHTSESALAASACLADMLVSLLVTGDIAAIGEVDASDPAIAHIAQGIRNRQLRTEISSSPCAVDTLEAAVWCVTGAANFEAAMIEAVNLGGDADTIGAVTGQLAGALFGAAAIPRRWVDRLHSADRLANLARRLHRKAV